MSDLSAIFKAYDIRGVVPDQLDADVARAVGSAMVQVLGIATATGKGTGTDAAAVVVGRDMRASSPELAAAFAEGVCAAGVDVIDIGLASTDLLYFGSGHLNLPGALFTASHNPARYNGIKLCGRQAAPISTETGLGEIAELVRRALDPVAGTPVPPVPPASRGRRRSQDLLDAYAKHLLGLVVQLAGMRRLKVVVDAGNGMAGYTVPAVFDQLNVQLVPLYFELDGSFPNHEANPLEPANLRDLQAAVRAHGADLGLAFDGDADRCFVVDERGTPISPSAVTALVAARELARVPGSVVIHNLICSQAVPQVIREHGGIPVRTRVGHSYVKAEMARTQAIFGGEHSAHYYFADFWRADTGMLAALHVLAALGSAGATASGLFAAYDRYCSSGELNTEITGDPAVIMAGIEAAYGNRKGPLSIDHLDGLSVTSPDGWWFNVRSSNTEPLLRLNVEAPDAVTMAQIRDDVLALITNPEEIDGCRAGS